MLIFALCFIAFVIIIFVVAISSQKKTEEANEEFTERLAKTGFKIDRQVTAGDNVLFVDNANKKWAVKSRADSLPQIFNFSDLIEFEICEDGNSIAKGRTGSALVGGLLFGVTGAIIGGAGSKKTEEICSTLQLRIQVNDINFPERVLYFINTATKKDSFVYKANIGSCRTIASTLSFIQNNGKTSNISTQEVNSLSFEEKMRQLSRLKDDGILSELEFEEKKKELLIELK